jgi:hypothetical protein
MKLYHVSPTKNRGSILAFGLEPLLATGKEQKVWLVDRSRLLWAIAHCSARHHVSVDQLDIWELPEVVSKLKRTAWRGVYSTALFVQPVTWTRAADFVALPDGKLEYA